jgi:putative sterol carrier protein
MRHLVQRAIDAGTRAFAQTVARTPDGRIERAMSPALLRGPILWTIFRVMPQRLDAKLARNARGVLEFRVRRPGSGPPDRYQVAIADGRARTRRNGTLKPTVAVEMGTVEFVRLIGGTVSAPELFMRGKVKVEGDVMAAARMSGLFRIPSVRRR